MNGESTILFFRKGIFPNEALSAATFFEFGLQQVKHTIILHIKSNICLAPKRLFVSVLQFEWDDYPSFLKTLKAKSYHLTSQTLLNFQSKCCPAEPKYPKNDSLSKYF